ncbi:MAG: VCBS repeat-containing protein [Planctomycetes bacterium]|nr:VCBS repeat-containing protein [Planctomycetota bacterium]
MSLHRRLAAFAAFATVAAAAACGPDEPSGGAPSGGGPASGAGGPSGGPVGGAPQLGGEPRAVTTLRELAAAHYGEAELVEGGFERAHEVLLELVKSPHATPEDQVDLACAKLKLHLQDPAAQEAETPKIRELCQQALARDPKLAAAHYVLGVIAFDREQDPARAKVEFALANEFAPDDVPTRMRLAEVMNELEERDRAIELYESVRAAGPEFAGSFYMPAIYRLARVLRQRKRVDAAAGIDDTKRAGELLAEHKRLNEAKAPNPSDDEIKLGNLGRVRPPPMRGVAGGVPTAPPAVRFTRHAPLFAGVRSLVAWDAADVDSDLREDVLALAIGADGAPQLLLAAQGEQGGFAVRPLAVDAALLAGATRVRAVDLENEFGMSVLLQGGGSAKLLAPSPDGSGALVDVSAQLSMWPAAVADLQVVDFGHDGHADLALATPQGLKLIRNDGLPRDPYTEERQGAVKLVDVTALAEGIGAAPCGWVAVEDFDSDQDIDLLVGGAGGETTLYTNLRKGRFAAVGAAKSGLPAALSSEPLLADLDHDGKPDALVPGDPPMVHLNRGDGTFGPGAPRTELAALWNGWPQLADVNLDGELDFVGAAANGELAVRYGALTSATAPLAPLPLSAAPAAALREPRLVDLDGDGDLDLLGAVASGGADDVALFCGEVAGGRSLRLDLRGKKDNRQAIGAIVELRAGDLYQRHLQRDRHYLAGLGGAKKIDLVRITWPNGVVQNLIEPVSDPAAAPPLQCAAGGAVAAVVRLAVLQKEGLAGSCPFLYSWNGTTYEFISDVLGITPLGLPMTESMYVPPDHDELVRVAGEQLAAQDGEYRFQVTEELREVTYLDRVQLWVVDHPVGVEVHPEERFCFPPFPPQKLHTVRAPLPLERAVDQAGRDWTAALAEQDGRHAVPFEPRDSRYLGLVTNHSLELALPEAVRDAKKVRLLMTGWLYWTDASVNVLADRNGSFGFLPPTFAVPDGAGGWRDCGPPIGFPAGKTKTMVVDVTSLLNRADLRLKVASSIRLYWDSIVVAVDDDDAPITVTKLEPKVARLWSRGFSAPIVDERDDQPERFDWNVMEPLPRWNQHHGMLTRYGSVLPLLGAIDDRFAIFSAGDAIDLRFDATTTPPQPGMARTYLVFFDGWAKDADPNTMHSQSVGPLPFHGMSGYPYGANERYPEDDLHLDYQLEWNTRAGKRLIAPLSSRPAAFRSGSVPPVTPAPIGGS